MVKSLSVDNNIEKKKTTVFINPASGNMRGEKLHEAFVRELEQDPALKERILSVIKTTEEQDDEIFRKTALESDHVIICGGDGTVHRVMNGLLKHSYRKSVSVYPVGTANDLAKNLKVEKMDFPSFVRKVISSGYSLKLDIFSVNKKVFFMNYAGFGFDAFVVDLNVKAIAWLKGFQAGKVLLGLPLFKKALFVLVGLLVFVTYEKRLVLNPHGKKYINLIFNNLSTYAGGSIFSEDSSFSDGKPERVFLSNKLDFIKLILNRFHIGVMVYDLGAATIKTPTKFSFREPDAPRVPVQLDGEEYTEFFSGTNEFEIAWEGRWDVYR
ncbi:MAG: diacylglycerol kinase family protein [Nitrospinota bacterium]|nr:diacylglycerol kinase family protein [Nitrospinota bacterium]